MNKARVLEQLVAALQHDLNALQTAVKVAQESATHGESVAENKYDTRGLEAAYLAHGQAMRAMEIETALLSFDAIPPRSLTTHSSEVGIHSFMQLADQAGTVRWLWLGADAGGLKFSFDSHDAMVVTPSSPLGAALMGRAQGDVIELRVAENLMEYEIIALY